MRTIWSKVARLTCFYIAHGFALLAGCSIYLFLLQPHLLDWTAFVSGMAFLVWAIYTSPLSSKLIGHESLAWYRTYCLRHFDAFIKTYAFLTLSLILLGYPMLTELWHRWTYVETIKRLTLDKAEESFPFPDVDELAVAFNLYPHRREVRFILGRLASVLAFDDETTNYNLFLARFLAKVNKDAILNAYRARTASDNYEYSMDPVEYLARLIVNAGNRLAAYKEAVSLLDKYRSSDPLAQMDQLIFRHEILEEELRLSSAPDQKQAFATLAQEIEQLIETIAHQTASKHYMELVTTNTFQELLDHYAQLQVEVYNTASAETIEKILVTYSRILTMRKLIASEADVPWFEGPGKLTVFQFFKHHLGRETNITRQIVTFYAKVPNLNDTLKKRMFDAEAFKEFRSLDTWSRGTPLSSSFSGKGMNRKLTEWLKMGW